jgi:hypothetical protein
MRNLWVIAAFLAWITKFLSTATPKAGQDWLAGKVFKVVENSSRLVQGQGE